MALEVEWAMERVELVECHEQMMNRSWEDQLEAVQEAQVDPVPGYTPALDYEE